MKFKIKNIIEFIFFGEALSLILCMAGGYTPIAITNFILMFSILGLEKLI